jgi:hypothetical protein
MKNFFQNIGKTEIRNILAVVITVGCFILLYLLQIKPIPAENQHVLDIAIGFVFGGALAGVVGFYFGASKTTGKPNSSDDKTNAQ